MELNSQTIFKNICSSNGDPVEIHRLLSSLNNLLIKEQLDETILDEYLLNAFNASHGLIKFLTTSINNKEYSKCMEKSLEIIYLLINNFPQKMIRNLSAIYDVSIVIVRSKKASSNEKRKAYEIFIISFQKVGLECEKSKLKEIYNWFITCLDLEKTDTVLEKLLIAIGTFTRYFPNYVQDPIRIRKIICNFISANKSALVCGSFSSLHEFSFSFPFRKEFETDCVVIKKIYNTIKNLALLTNQTHSKVGNRAALTYFISFITLFEDFVINDVKFWISISKSWVESTNADNHKLGFALSNAIHQNIADFVMKKHDQSYTNVLTVFKNDFLSTIQQPYCSSYKRSLALEGLSTFSASFQHYFTQIELNNITITILKLLEDSHQSNLIENETEYLPNYLKLSIHFLPLQTIENSEIIRLQKGVVNIIKLFPRFHESAFLNTVNSVISCFLCLKTKHGKIYDEFVTNVVYQGVVWSCSHQHISAIDTNEGVVTIYNYLKLWKGLISNKNNKINQQDFSEISTKIVEKLVKTLLGLTNKLNVEIITTDFDSRVVKEDDYAIFLNVADFYNELLRHIDVHFFMKSIGKLIQHFIGKCVKFPMISGFYKLLAVCLKISLDLNYFKDWENNLDAKLCYQSLKKFFTVFFVTIQQFTDELLITCLQLLLETSPIFIEDMLQVCTPVFITIITTGRTYLKLVDMAIDILIIWQSEIDGQKFEEFLNEILPYFDFFLRSNSLDSLSCAVLKSARKTDQVLKKRKVVVEIEAELLRVQKKILHFIGSQNLELYEKYVFHENCIDLAVWGSEQHLKIVFPYEDLRVDVYLDKIMPRIIDLAINSTDKKTKVAACELLHSMVLIFLGTTKQMSHSGIKDLSKLFTHLATPLLKLGCDINPITRHLFEPLTFQIIHWYTHKLQQNEHSNILIDAILEGITNSFDSTLRKFSSKCINEYIKWIIKQNNPNNPEPPQIKYLIKKMYFFSLHPDLYKKLGAALIFNNIYREFREEKNFFAMFWIEFLYMFIKGLSFFETQTNLYIIKEIDNAIRHIQRGFVEKSSLFNEPNSKRRYPTDIKSELLTDVVVWVFWESNNINLSCRRTCMDFFLKVTPLCKGFVNFEHFLTKNVNIKDEIYLGMLLQYPTLQIIKQTNCESTFVLKWQQSLLCSLDGIDFFNKINWKASQTFKNHLKTAVDCFIHDMALKTFKETLNFLQINNCSYTIFEEQEYQNLKSEILLKILKMTNLFLTSSNFELLELFLSKKLNNLIIYLIFHQDSWSFDQSESISDLLKIFFATLPQSEKNDLILTIKNLLKSIDLNQCYSIKERNFVKGLLLLQYCDLPHLKLEELSKDIVLKVIGIGLETLLETSTDYISNVLKFVLCYDNEFKSLINNPALTNDVIFKGETKMLGLIFLEMFEEAIMPAVINKFELFIQEFIITINELKVEFVIHLLNHLVGKKMLKNIKEKLVNDILKFWNDLETFFQSSFDRMKLGLNFVKSLINLLSFNNSSVIVWLIQLIQNNNVEESSTNLLEFNIDVISILIQVMKTQDTVSHSLNKLLFLDKMENDLKQIGFNRLNTILPNIQNIDLLICVLYNYALTQQEIQVDFSNSLKEFIQKCDLATQELCLTSLYQVCLDNNLNDSQKYKLINTSLPVFHSCAVSILETFFVKNIVTIVDNLEELVIETNILNKIANFLLCEIMFLRCFSNSNNEFSQISSSFKNFTNKKFFKMFLLILLNTCKNDVNLNPRYKDWIRKLKCHSYNCSISLICNCIKDARFYSKLFLRKECSLWKTLIDMEKCYDFHLDFDVIPKQKTFLVNIKDNSGVDRKDSKLNKKYLETMRVYNSSLSEDFTKFDFTESTIRFHTDLSFIETGNETEVELEGVDINEHECMATVCGLIKHLLTLEDENKTILDAIGVIRTILLNENSHQNEKIFWVKVVVNTSHLLHPFADILLEPLLTFIVGNSAQTSLNYFVTDILQVLTTWGSTPQTPEEVTLASDLLRFLIKELSNERRDRFKYYLELIKIFVELWKTTVKVPYDLIKSKLYFENQDALQKVEVGIHLCIIFLVNGIAPWENSYSDLKLFKMILKCTSKSIYKSIAETIGVILNFLMDKDDFKKALSSTNKLLKCLTNKEQYANVLEALVLRFPAIADASIINILILQFESVNDDLKIIYLKVILNRFDILQHVQEFTAKDWSCFIESDKIDIQVLTLNIIIKTFHTLKTTKYFSKIVKTVCKLVDHSNIVCRALVYEIAALICQNEIESLLEICLEVLIQGFIDKDLELREKNRRFWHESQLLSKNIQNRFVFILERLYSPGVENIFLGYSCNLLLDILRMNEKEYNRFLFEFPLEDCHFENYDLNFDLKMKSAIPMFAQTYNTYTSTASTSSGLELSTGNLDQLKKTQNYRNFEPTHNAYSMQSQYTASQSSLSISLGTFLNPNSITLSNEYKKPKKRFLKDQYEIKKSFAKYEIKKSVINYQKRLETAKKRDNEVTLYRKYRIGDLPDIQICLHALIEPLKVLVLLDGEVAQCIFLTIFEGIIAKVEVRDEFLNKTSMAVQNIFSVSTDYNINLFRTLFSVVLRYKENILVEPELVKKISESAGLISIGTLLLEEYLMVLEDTNEGSSSKKTSGFVSNEINYWLNLSELYKNIDEWDMVKAIFLEKITCHNYAKEAVIAESQKDWRTAEDLYKDLLQTNLEPQINHHYTELHFKCLEYLGRWDEILEECNSFKDLWDKNWRQQKLLPFYLRAQLKKALFNGEADEFLLFYLNETLLSENSGYLQNNFSEEMAMFFLNEDINQTEYYVNNSLKSFLFKWQLMDRSYSNHRFNSLLKLQNIMDIKKFINVCLVDSQSMINDVVKYWKRTNNTLPTAFLTEMRILYRKQFVNCLEKKISFKESGHLEQDLTNIKATLFSNIVNVAILEDNFDLARKYLYLCDDQPFFKFYLAKVGFIKLAYVEDSHDKIKLLLNSLLEIESWLSNQNHSRQYLEAQICSFTYLNKLAQILNENNESFRIYKNELLQITRNSQVESKDDLCLFAAARLQNYLELCSTKNEELDLIGNAYVKLAYFSSKNNDCSNFVLTVLRGMRFDSAEARQLFSCILLRNLSEDVQQIFITELNDIPIWMFLDWIPQILISIDSDNISAIEPLILKIAKLYPQAVMYTYRLSKKNFDFTKLGIKSKNLIAKLDELLCSNTYIDDFLAALSYVGVPSAILLYYVRKMMKLPNNTEELNKIIDIVEQELFNELGNSKHSLRGNLFKQINHHRTNILKIRESNLSQKQTILQKVNTALMDEIKSMQKFNNDLLKNFSPWLANFSGDLIDLEIPGQYNSKKPPLIQYHIKISGFCPNVLIVQSLRKPIKLTIIGHDGKEYPYLIKFGEDLRQDQRIQQLFTLMNDFLKNDKSYISHDLNIETYKVVPLSPKIGLIQWIENTESFTDFMSKSGPSLATDPNFDSYQKFLTSNRRLKNDVDLYINAAKNYPEEKVVPFYRSLVNSIPDDVMKKSFLGLSTNTESFYVLRTNFIKNYAILCCSHWLLGIGDRHLQNLLVYIKTGKVLGVDFGHAFGTATQFLPIPELVPFRLTPHITNIMQPLGERGLFKQICIYFLRLIRSKSSSLLATMEVFIQEPSLDWLEHVARFEESSDTNMNWYSQLKIDQAKQKLFGTSSTAIMVEELKMGQQNNPALEKLIEHVTGKSGRKLRSSFVDHGLSVEDQVDGLIDHATDFNLLGRMFSGWQPWV